MNEDIDNGDVMECLMQNKGAPEMNAKCRSYVNHFELVRTHPHIIDVLPFSLSCS